MTRFAIECEGLQKIFKSPGQKKPLQVLGDITFSIKKGTSLAITGGNGSGKTTLLKVLSTLFLAEGGNCKILGHDLIKEPRLIRERTSFVSAGLDFQRKLTLKENLEFFAMVQGSSIEPALKFLDEMNMTHILNQRAETFSEGQKAITRLAIGLMKTKSEIFMLDEVTLGLDVTRKEEVIDYLKKVIRNKTLLIVDHDSDVIERLCDEVLILRTGGYVESILSVKELMKSLPYSHEITAVPVKPLLDRDVKEIWPHFVRNGGILKFYPTNKTQAERITHRLIKSDLMSSLQTRKIDLNEYAIRYSQTSIEP